MILFIDTGLDCNLAKSLDKSGLVQKEITVQGKNGTFTRKQWVKGTSDNHSPEHWIQAEQSETAKKKILDMLSSGKTRHQIMSEFKSLGVTWKECDHPGINWMRASMAINKYLTSKSNSHKDPSKIDLTCSIYQNIGDAIPNQISSSVDTAVPIAKSTWLKYEKNLKAITYASKNGAYFSPSDMGISMNLQVDIDNYERAKKWDEDNPTKAKTYGLQEERVVSKFSTFFHGFYHNIDKLSGLEHGSNKKYFSEIYQDGFLVELLNQK